MFFKSSTFYRPCLNFLGCAPYPKTRKLDVQGIKKVIYDAGKRGCPLAVFQAILLESPVHIKADSRTSAEQLGDRKRIGAFY